MVWSILSMVAVHFWVEIWIKSMVSLFMMHWIHSMVFAVILMVIWVTTVTPVGVSMMVTNIPVLVTWKMFLSTSIMVICGLSSHWCNMSWMVVEISVHVMMIVGLHLKHEVSLLNIGLGGAESCAISIKGGVVTLVPSVGVESIEIIFPVEIKATSLMIVGVGLDIVIK